MDRIKLKKKALKLRRQGKTYSEIQDNLRTTIPESTLSFWCKNVPLPPEYHNKIRLLNIANREKGRKAALIVNKIKRENYLLGIRERNIKFFKNLDTKAKKLALAMLYLGEGARWKSHRGQMLGSSDPIIIKIYLKLLRTVYKINLHKLKCRISYRADQNIKELEEYWSNITKIPLKNFYKTKPDPRTVGKKTLKKDYKGVCIIYGGSTEIQLELEMIPRLVFLGP